MEKNIFKNAYFGKPYKTRDDRTAIYSHCIDNKIYLMYQHYYINNDSTYLNYGYVDKNGYSYDNQHLSDDDIVSELQEEIDEEELAKIAEESSKTVYTAFMKLIGIWISGFKAGYRKAKEN